jgi:hypothetical protein
MFILLLQSCSIIGQYSIAETKVGSQIDEEYNTYFLYKYPQEGRIESPSIELFLFNSIDSASFYIEPFSGGNVILLGFPYVPVIPNIFQPILYLYYNRKTDYHAIISHFALDSIDIRNISFYINKKRIIYDNIDIVVLNDMKPTHKEFYMGTLKQDALDFTIYPNKFYLLTFNNIRTYNIKEIEIKYKEKTMLHIKRKKKMYHKIIIAN